MWIERSRAFAIKWTTVMYIINNQGLFVQDKLTQLSQDEKDALVTHVEQYCWHPWDLSGVRTTLQLVCLPCYPPVLAHVIAAIDHALICSIVCRHINCHQTTFMLHWDIDALEQQYQAFHEVISHEQWLKHTLEASDSQTSFINSWKILNSHFPKLESFCGGLTSVFPEMSQVESDFSIIKFEKDDFHSQLSGALVAALLFQLVNFIGHCDNYSYYSFCILCSVRPRLGLTPTRVWCLGRHSINASWYSKSTSLPLPVILTLF